VTVTARTIVRDLVLQADRIDPGATVSEQCISLLPGESHTFHISSAIAGNGASGLDAWTRYPVLQGVGIGEASITAPTPHAPSTFTQDGTRQ
jgi:beta-mannosidase